MRWIGIDLGEKRVGLSVSDAGGSIAFPHSVAPRDTILDALRKLLAEYPDCAGFVVGMPKTLRGEEGGASKIVNEFVEQLKVEIGQPVHLWDERLSTRAVSRPGVGKKVDALAAQFILQGYLDRQGASSA